jgi:hypothetical protein
MGGSGESSEDDTADRSVNIMPMKFQIMSSTGNWARSDSYYNVANN